jgi:hypothetical protein
MGKWQSFSRVEGINKLFFQKFPVRGNGYCDIPDEQEFKDIFIILPIQVTPSVFPLFGDCFTRISD